jgi:hypothetical protein
VLPAAGFHVIVETPSPCVTTTPSSTSAGNGSPTPEQTPPTQASPVVQVLASSHGNPSARFGREQSPVDGLQAPTSWQASMAVHTMGLAPAHVPLKQASSVVQALPSSHGFPSAASGFEHAPSPTSHVPGSWHSSTAAHSIGAPLAHAPPTQVSSTVQPFPSLQAAPSAASGFEQAPVAVSQAPAVWH